MLKIENDKEDAMVDLVLKAEQIRLAPLEVKEWIRSVVLAELAPGPERGQDETAEAALAECTVEEAGLVLEPVRDDYLAAQVFLELGREPAHNMRDRLSCIAFPSPISSITPGSETRSTSPRASTGLRRHSRRCGVIRAPRFRIRPHGWPLRS